MSTTTPDLPGMPPKSKLKELIEKRVVLLHKKEELKKEMKEFNREISKIFREQKKKSLKTEINGKMLRITMRTYESRIAVFEE